MSESADDLDFFLVIKPRDEQDRIPLDTLFVSKGKDHIQVSTANVPGLLFMSVYDAAAKRYTNRRIRFDLLRDTLLDLHDRLEKEGKSSI